MTFTCTKLEIKYTTKSALNWSIIMRAMWRRLVEATCHAFLAWAKKVGYHLKVALFEEGTVQ